MTQVNEPSVHAAGDSRGPVPPGGDAAAFLQALAEAVAAILQPKREAWTKAEAAVRLGCTGSWLEGMARKRKIPFTRLSGSLHFTDEHLAEIIRIFEVRPLEPVPPRPAAPARAAGTWVLPEPAPGREPVTLRARPPRRRGDRTGRAGTET